jgi:ATP-dependent DNA helicase RecQ
MLNSKEILKKYFGYSEFREGQEEIISNICAGRDVVGIMPTGAGKSICYQIPAMMFDGVSIVISPLISLMKNQVQSLTQVGISAAYINSSLSADEYDDILRRASHGDFKVIYVAPERLIAPDFIKLADGIDISMVTVDEAHCISQWGQDFRPSYIDIPEFIKKLSHRPVVSAFTATATVRVRADIAKQLELENAFTMLTGFDRPNLYFEVRKPKNKINELLNILASREDRSGIIYCSTRKDVDMVTIALHDVGYSSAKYHAGLSDGIRRNNQNDFQFDKKTIMVATNAFGMGIDKSNVGYVIHYNMPKNLESYYQEAGRAGRDGSAADCILLFGGNDIRTNRFLIEKNFKTNPDMSSKLRDFLLKKNLELLAHMTAYTTTTYCLRNYILKYFGEDPKQSCGNCGTCDTTFEDVDVTSDARKVVSCLAEMSNWRQTYGRAYGKTMISEVLRGSVVAKVMEAGFNHLLSHGIMADASKQEISEIIDGLIANRYASVTEDRYPVVTLTEKHKEFMRNHMELHIKRPTDVEIFDHSECKPRAPAKNKIKQSKPRLELEPASKELFSKLKLLRRAFADSANVPAFVIFSDASLRDMCSKMPKTASEFLEVSGVGATKLERYGKKFIREIADYSR